MKYPSRRARTCSQSNITGVRVPTLAGIYPAGPTEVGTLTRGLSPKDEEILFCRREDGRSVVSNANRNARARTESRQTFDPRKVKAQAARAHLHSQTRLALRFSSQ